MWNTLQEIRKWFPLTRQTIYLNSCSKGLLAEQVRVAMYEYVQTWQEAGAPWDTWLNKIEEVRQGFAVLVNAATDEIAVTFCVSTGTNAIASSLEFGRHRNKVVMSGDEFPTMAHIWLAQRRYGADVQFITARKGESVIEAFERAIDERTLVVVAHQIHHRTGAYLDVKKLAQISHARGAYLFLDAYHSAGVIDIDVKALDVDFLVTGCMKYLLGSTGGVALLYVKDSLISQLEPTYTGWFSQKDIFTFSQERLEYDDTARRFESGLQPIAEIYAAAAGMDILHQIDVSRIEAHVSALARCFAEGAKDIGLDVLTPANHYGPMVCIRANNADAVVKQLAQSNILVANWGDSIRFSFHCYNTLDEVQTALHALSQCQGLSYTNSLGVVQKGGTKR